VGISKLRIIFMGTAELACPILKALCREPDFQVEAIVTQPDRPRGRNLELQPSPVKAAALSEGLSVLQPERARNAEFIAKLSELQPDLIVVVAYGQILPQALLEIPRFGCLNVHTSLLPKYRGAAPIQWAILNDEPETGVSIMKMDAGLDTGAVLSEKRTPISPEDNSQTLHDRLATLGAELIVPTVHDFVAGRITPKAQPAEGGSYARKITKEDGRIDWTQPARVLWNRIRAFTPWPGAFTFQPAEPKPRLLKIWKANAIGTSGGSPGEVKQMDKNGIVVACGGGSLMIKELQREGGRRVTAQEFFAGAHLKVGDRLS
jgi:methionyl-tRNA formyltransferase